MCNIINSIGLDIYNDINLCSQDDYNLKNILLSINNIFFKLFTTCEQRLISSLVLLNANTIFTVFVENVNGLI